MLSRIAESLFWIGRYIERADGTARILDVHLERLNQLPQSQQREASQEMLTIMGSWPSDEEYGLQDLLQYMAYDRKSGASIAGALVQARENARRARETVSSNLWETLNTTYYGLNQQRKDVVGAFRFCHWVLERTAMMRGFSDSTMSKDDSWQFLQLGRALETADMTARMLAAVDTQSSGLSWVTMLRSAGAYESFLRTQGVAFGEKSAAEFLLLDRWFPRSIVSSFSLAEDCLIKLDPSVQRVGFDNDARRIVGQARSFLEFHHSENILDELPEHMERVQRAVAQASDAVTRRYFSHIADNAWVGEKA
ncbi:putative alpha-E superfamily protein [Neomicrococcus aestuarii]|uniref:Putative alpha-E superfamily protein n=1 Tax=Neomicrococcus aestuarii TaxID=556325 RepID=A0A7W8TUM3_9MICC|nr:alpha-E domain-containing protein [Neomicrococcus aestuarii]MBB5511861.1 putative alpha-E superfamily protein [Neomicrococcus aestuarii]